MFNPHCKGCRVGLGVGNTDDVILHWYEYIQIVLSQVNDIVVVALSKFYKRSQAVTREI